jgi:rhamnosyltransferase
VSPAGPAAVGVVVTYNPGPYLAGHLRALREQIAQVVVVDNGSSDVEAVRRACGETGCRLVRNDRNLGIAAALNQGAAAALEAGAEWLAMFDQDSLPPPGAVDALLQLARAHPRSERIGVIAMTHSDRGTGRPYHAPSDVLEEGPGWRVLRTTITSGSLARCAVLRELGGFEERLFIDFVDHEFCLRLRRHGWLVVEAPDVVMTHSMGASREHRFLGRRMVLTHHGAWRRYFMTRNQLEIYSRNLLFDPVWSARGLATLAVGTVAMLLVEEQAPAKLRAVLRACRDFALRRFGPGT